MKLMLLLAASLYLIISISSCSQEVSVTPPDSAPPNGYIFINSNPTGFNIYLDGKERRRTTPDSITWLSTGSHLVTLKKDLYKDTSLSVNAIEGEKFSVYVDFTKNVSMKGNITCTSSPSNCEIFINDSSTGLYTPNTLTILPGNYYIKYHLNNHRDDSVLISVSSGKKSTAKIILVDTTLWQDYTTSNSGIPTNSITCVAVDKNNIIYAGSNGSYYFSFDGTTWETYYSSLSNIVDCIMVDANNKKYIGTNRGMAVFYSETSIKEYGLMSSGFPDFHINAIVPDGNGNCFVGTNASITEFPNWTDYTPVFSDVATTISITSLVMDANNNIWAGIKSTGIAKVVSKKSWELYTSSSANLISDDVTALAVTSSGEVWAGFDNGSVFGNGLSYFNGSSWTKVYPIPTSSKTNTIFIDKNDIKWVGTNQGLITFSSPSSVTTFNYDNTGLNINNVTGISQDSNGNIWIATSSGLYKYKGSH